MSIVMFCFRPKSHGLNTCCLAPLTPRNPIQPSFRNVNNIESSNSNPPVHPPPTKPKVLILISRVPNCISQPVFFSFPPQMPIQIRPKKEPRSPAPHSEIWNLGGWGGLRKGNLEVYRGDFAFWFYFIELLNYNHKRAGPNPKISTPVLLDPAANTSLRRSFVIFLPKHC